MKRKLRHAVWRAIEGRATVEGRVGSWDSRCLLCGLSSGPWALRLKAAVSGLVHLQRHHSEAEES